MGRKAKSEKASVTATDYPQTPFLLSEKKIPLHNILVGEDPVQVRFAELFLGVKSQVVENVRDYDLLGKEERQLLQVNYSSDVDLSPMVQKKTGIWSLAPLDEKCPGLNEIVRHAAKIMGVKPGKTFLNQVVRELTRSQLDDIRAGIWKAAYSLVGEEPKGYEDWPMPWAQPMTWFPAGEEPTYRLNSLYRDLVGYVFAKEDDVQAARKFGISQRRFGKLKEWALDINKVEKAINELSRWRNQKYDPYICALKISAIWAKPTVLS